MASKFAFPASFSLLFVGKMIKLRTFLAKTNIETSAFGTPLGCCFKKINSKKLAKSIVKSQQGQLFPEGCSTRPSRIIRTSTAAYAGE